jgi:hypothetical protein
VVTSIFLYLPLFGYLLDAAREADLLDGPSIAAMLLMAALFHVWEVGHNVFRRW